MDSKGVCGSSTVEPPRGARGRRLLAMQLRDALRDEVLNGVGAYHAMWFDIYEWLGRPIRKPPRPRDMQQMAADLVAAFERGRLVAMLEPYDPIAWPDAPDTQRTPRERPVGEELATTWFSLRIVDEVGDALDGLEVKYEVLGEQRDAKTNAAGVAKIDTLSTGFARAAIRDLRAVRAKLRERWKEAREERIAEGGKIVVREIGEEVTEPIGLECEAPTTLVIKPHFRCHEVRGAHFDFGRSFVKRDAIQDLAGIAEELSVDDGRKGMIFGHTDLSGEAPLNKELSERRAKAVYALLTHDADAWEALFSGTADGKHWQEKWDVEEAQHMLNALGVTDDEGEALDEDGVRGERTKQAIHRFQAGDYPDKPGEQKALAQSDYLGKAGRKELFLAYAKRITRHPIDKVKLERVNGAASMGCGEYNPLSASAKDAESRRVVVFVFDVAATPQGLPCALRSVGACKGQLRGENEPPKDEKRPYRCKVYERVSRNCTCHGGADLSHDLIVRIPVTLREAQDMPHVFVLEADDGTIRAEKRLASDARALDDGWCEIYFAALPELHSYRLLCEMDGYRRELFPFTRYEAIPNLLMTGDDATARGAGALAMATNDDDVSLQDAREMDEERQ